MKWEHWYQLLTLKLRIAPILWEKFWVTPQKSSLCTQSDIKNMIETRTNHSHKSSLQEYCSELGMHHFQGKMRETLKMEDTSQGDVNTAYAVIVPYSPLQFFQRSGNGWLCTSHFMKNEFIPHGIQTRAEDLCCLWCSAISITVVGILAWWHPDISHTVGFSPNAKYLWEIWPCGFLQPVLPQMLENFF